jgi:hypothetical protein
VSRLTPGMPAGVLVRLARRAPGHAAAMDEHRDQRTEAAPQTGPEAPTEPLPVPEEALASGAEDGPDPYGREAAINQLTAPADSDR